MWRVQRARGWTMFSVCRWARRSRTAPVEPDEEAERPARPDTELEHKGRGKSVGNEDY